MPQTRARNALTGRPDCKSCTQSETKLQCSGMEAGMVPMTLVMAAVLGIGGDLEDGVYDFSGQNCHYCRKMDPIVRQLQRYNYPIRTIECESNFELVKRFDVRTI